MVSNEVCPICKREIRTNDITIHHLKPQSKGGTIDDTIRICKTCHDALHYYIDLEEVDYYHSIQKLLDHPIYGQYVKWIRKINHGAWCPIKKVESQLHLAK